MNKIKIKTIYGKILTITVSEQNEEYLSGFDKFGAFVKVPLKDIENCMPMGKTR